MTSDAARLWLNQAHADVPPALRAAMERALDAANGQRGQSGDAFRALPEHLRAPLESVDGAAAELARGALVSLWTALGHGEERSAALPLLAADALVTAALESADTDELRVLVDALRPEQLAAILAEDGQPVNTPNAGVLDALHRARLEEKRQALFYRSLASQAEDAGDADLSERLNGLHADEQHHLSRLTVRLVEFGESVADLGSEPVPAAALAGWESEARRREQAEIERYEALLDEELDTRTREMLDAFLVAERQHERELGGKWMGAQEGDPEQQ